MLKTEGICYFAELVRHQRTLQAKVLSLIAPCLLSCQIGSIRLSLFCFLSSSCLKNVFYKTEEDSAQCSYLYT